jgi:drug/metabolite transporter (DMT)-like permease
MTAARIAGMVLIVVGLVGILWGGFSFTREKTVVDVGPFKATTQERETIPFPPVAGAIALVAGVVLLVLPARRKS